MKLEKIIGQFAKEINVDKSNILMMLLGDQGSEMMSKDIVSGRPKSTQD